MPAFFFEWKDFKGGYFVGPSETTQPPNTWRGKNVTIADDDATLVPTYEQQRITLTGSGTSAGILTNGTSTTEWSEATYFNGYVSFLGRVGSTATIYFVNTATGALTSAVVATTATKVKSAPVLVTESGDMIAYCVVGNSSIYRIVRITLAITSVTPGIAFTTPFDGLTLWNARLIAWSNSTDIFVFSDPLSFLTFQSLNYVGVGYSNDGISYVIPRNMDMIIVKPSGWYSVTGILGVSAAVRQMNDTLGIVQNDPVGQHNNVVYFMTSTGFKQYSVNLMAISGTRVDVAAYHRFGLFESSTDIAKTNMGYLAVVTTTNTASSSTANIYLLNALERWQVMEITNTANNRENTKYTLANGQVSRFGNASDQYIYLIEQNSGATYNNLSVIRLRPNTVEPGKLAANDNPSEAVVRLSDVDSKMATIIRRVYVEAELMQFPSGQSPYTGSASMQVRVNNKAVEDIPFSMTVGDATSGYSTPYTFPFSSFTASSSDLERQTRVLRFNVDNASYGYTNEIEIKFAGFRIRRVWVEGDSR